MKAFKLFFFGIMLFFAGVAQAQMSVNVNVGTPPQWGPAGYTDVQYYYLPDVEAYYDIPSSKFIYYSGGTWVHRTYLPSRYRNYDLYNGYKVVMTDYRGNAPYTHFKDHKVKYAKGYKGLAQKNIGERPEKRNSNEGRYANRSNKKESHNYSQGGKHGNDKNNGKGHEGGGGKGKKNK